MTAPDILLADDVVAGLNAQTFSLPFTAERVYVADWDAKAELNTLQCAVWPEEPTADRFERDELLKTYPIAVAFCQRLQQKTRDELDALCNLVSEVTDWLELQQAETGGRMFVNAGWEFRLRFHMDSLDRTKKSSGEVAYTGVFASVVAFPFVLLD